jgi:hypothetical protein
VNKNREGHFCAVNSNFSRTSVTPRAVIMEAAGLADGITMECIFFFLLFSQVQDRHGELTTPLENRAMNAGLIG